MTDERPARWRVLAAALLAAIVGVALVYGAPSPSFYYDDYHFVRPPLGTESHRIWFGSWDVTGSESEFFRPITAWLFLGRFWLLGTNAYLMHAISLAGHVLCAGLLADLIQRTGASARAALIGAVLYAVYPALPISQTSWLTNQMHLVETLLVLSALLLWQRAGLRRWPMAAIAVLAVLAFLVKEDGLMLLVAIGVLTAAGGLTGTPLTPRARTMVPVAAAVLAVALVWFRQDRLGALGGYGVPDSAQGIANLWRGIAGAVLLWPTRRPWQSVAAVLAAAAAIGVAIEAVRARQRAAGLAAVAMALALLPAARWLLQDRPPYPLFAAQAISSGAWLAVLILGVWSLLRLRDAPLTRLFILGLVVTGCFNAPFVLVSKREQLHLVSLGAVLCGTVAIEAILRLRRARWPAAVAVTMLVAVPFTLLARSQAAAFAPCSEFVLAGDEAAAGWWVVPGEIRQFLRDKPQQCASGSVRSLTDLDQVWWGTFEAAPSAGDEGSRWTEDRATALFRREARRVALELRTARPVNVTAVVDGVPQALVLPADVWTAFTFDLRPGGLLVWLRDAHRLDLIVDGWVVPADHDPASTDLKRHGVQLGSVRVE